MASMSNDSLTQLRATIDAAMKVPVPAAAAAAAPAPGAAVDFCSVWPTAKPILQSLAGIIILIPGFGTTAGAVLNALLTVGDQVFNATCKK